MNHEALKPHVACLMQDAECDRSNVPRALFMDHVFAHLLMTYGAKSMVTEFAACLMVSAKRHRALDLRIEVCHLCPFL